MAHDYRQASRDIWDQMAAGWDDDRRWIWDASRPVGEWLVDALDPQPGETILELAAGVGDTGLAAKANLWASVPAAALAEHTGQEPPDPHAPGIFAMASEERTRELLTEAGLTPRRVEHVEMEWSFRTPDDHWRYVMDLAGALAMVVRSLPEDEQAAVRRLTEQRLEPMVRRPGYVLGGVCLNVLAE